MNFLVICNLFRCYDGWLVARGGVLSRGLSWQQARV